MDAPSTPAAARAPETAKEQAGALVEQAKTTAADAVEQRKTQATDLLDETAGALHDAADALRDGDHDVFARYAESAADQVAHFTDSIRSKSVGQLLDEAEGFARRDPGLFLSGAFLLGIFGARFVKASAPPRAGRAGLQRNASYGGMSTMPARRSGAAGPGSGPPVMSPPGALSAAPSASRVESRTGTPRVPAGHLDLGPTHTPVGGSGLTTGTPTGVGTPGTGSMGGGVPGPGSGSGTPGTGSTGGGVPGSDA